MTRPESAPHRQDCTGDKSELPGLEGISAAAGREVPVKASSRHYRLAGGNAGPETIRIERFSRAPDDFG